MHEKAWERLLIFTMIMEAVMLIWGLIIVDFQMDATIFWICVWVEAFFLVITCLSLHRVEKKKEEMEERERERGDARSFILGDDLLPIKIARGRYEHRIQEEYMKLLKILQDKKDDDEMITIQESAKPNYVDEL